MKMLVLGSGLMGPAAAFCGLGSPDVEVVGVCDRASAALERCARQLSVHPQAAKLTMHMLDLTDHTAAVKLMRRFDVAVATLPWEANALALEAALEAKKPLVGIARPPYQQMDVLRQTIVAAGGQVLIGCGLEPGLTEIMGHHAACQFERIDTLHIRCGGIPEQPAPPLGYKIVFGGAELPLHEREVYTLREGQLQRVPRFSGVETLLFPEIGECEAWFDGMLPWLTELPALRTLQTCTQKTIRWPGYAAKVSVLRELGLLSETLVEVDGVQVVPKRVVDTVLRPWVTFQSGDRDIVLFQVEAEGLRAGQPCRMVIRMSDRYDPIYNLTAMARTTSFTAVSIAQMLGRGDLDTARAVTPEQLISGPLVARLLDDLASAGIIFQTAFVDVSLPQSPYTHPMIA